MSWHPNDLLVDTDLTAYESTILTQFGQSNWQGRRTKVFEDWLFPILRVRGFNPQKLRTRYEADKVLGYTAAAYSDLTSAAKSATEDDVNLATIFATVGTDAIYIGSKEQFRGVFVNLLDNVSAVASVLSVAYWNGIWQGLTVSDGTSRVAGKAFSGGGSVTWTLPSDWVTRPVNSADRDLYWVKVTVSATPTGAKSGQVGVIRASALRSAVTLRTLQLILREASTRTDGPWKEKADFYETESQVALERALEMVAAEFDTDESDLVSDEEETQTAEEAGASSGMGGSSGFTLERA